MFHLDELRVLLQRQSIDSNNDEDLLPRPVMPPSTRPFKPIVLTRDMLQATAIGQGYPSPYTMTIDQFYESLAQRGLAPTPEQAKEMASGRVRHLTKSTTLICFPSRSETAQRSRFGKGRSRQRSTRGQRSSGYVELPANKR